MIRLRVVLLLVFLVLMIASTLNTTAQAQGSADVAIFVVDVFEPPPQVELPTSTNAGPPVRNCAWTFDGMDGVFIQGNDVITTELHPYAEQHGVLVRNHLRTLLGQDFQPDRSEMFPSSTVEGERWIRNDGLVGIWLVPVESSGYDFNIILENLALAVQAVRTLDTPISRYVVNMSFGLVPCDDFPTVSYEDYIDLLDAFGVTCGSEFEGPLQDLRCDFIQEYGALSDELVNALLQLKEDGDPEWAAFALLHQLIVRRDGAEALANLVEADLGSAAQQESLSLASADLLNAFLAQADASPVSDEDIIWVASAGNDNLRYPYFPAVLTDVLSVSADYSTSNSCMPGTRSEIVSYLIGALGFSPQGADTVTRAVLSPRSNDGEVQDNGRTEMGAREFLPGAPDDQGILGCLFGTSFAAPRVSLRMAQHLAVGGPTSCNAPDGSVVNPPLASRRWINVPLWKGGQDTEVMEGVEKYCPQFDVP